MNLRLPLALFLALASCTSSPGPVSLPEESETIVETYLVEHIGVSGFGGEVFCPFEVLGQDTNGTRLYIWTLCAEYQLIGSDLEMGTASSLPVSLTLDRRGDLLEVIGHQTPPEGWSADALEEIFPPKIIESFCFQNLNCHNERATRLQHQAEQSARDFYHLTP